MYGQTDIQTDRCSDLPTHQRSNTPIHRPMHRRTLADVQKHQCTDAPTCRRTDRHVGVSTDRLTYVGVSTDALTYRCADALTYLRTNTLTNALTYRFTDAHTDAPTY